MRKLTRTLMLTAVVAALTAAPAEAKKTPHKYSSTLASTTLSTASGYPGAGGTALLAGWLETKALGAGALVDHITIAGVQGNVIYFTGTEIDYFAAGSARSVLRGTSTVNGDGSQDLVVNGRFIGGAGRYKGASGSYRFTGTTPPNSSLTSGHSKGSITF